MFKYISFSVEIKQKYLRLSVRNGKYIINIRSAVDRWCQVGTNDKLIDVNDAVLCILHLELQCTDNKISNFWNEGFSNRKQPKMVSEYKEAIEKIVNEGKIGNSSHQNQWTFPSNKAKDGVASDFSLKGGSGKTILSKSDRMIDEVFKYHSDNVEEEKAKWKEVLKKYNNIIHILNRRYEFGEDNILEFQRVVDEYSDEWAKLTGIDGQTNYEHFLRTGHVSHFFYLYGNYTSTVSKDSKQQ